MKEIRISPQTYRRLQGLASPFEDSEENVVVRLLDFYDSNHHSGGPNSSNQGQPQPVSPSDLVTQGGIVPHGTKLRAVYKGTQFPAEVQDGRVIWNGEQYSSLSAAAVAIIQSTGSLRSTEDGWRFLEYLDEKTDTWRSLNDFRQKI